MTLEWWVVALLLFSALLHASWNAITKASGDPLLTVWVVTLTGSIGAGVGVLFVDFPHRDAWPYLIASIALHFVYQLFLVFAYRLGDLSQVYPVARGLAPCIVAWLAATFAGEVPSRIQWFGLGVVAAAIGSLALDGGGARRRGGLAMAVATGFMIGGYTFIDGTGVRLSDDPFDYIAWMLFLDGLPITLAVLFLRRRRIPDFLRSGGRSALGGGVMATLGYTIVMWAMSRGGMAHVSALRETSVVLAAVIGTRMLGEPFGARRVAAACAVVIGIALLQS